MGLEIAHLLFGLAGAVLGWLGNRVVKPSQPAPTPGPFPVDAPQVAGLDPRVQAALEIVADLVKRKSKEEILADARALLAEASGNPKPAG